MENYARFRYQPCLPLGKDGRRVTASKEHIELSKKAATEGIVLLKNDGTLPLHSDNTVALFGKATIEYIKGGGGSGDRHGQNKKEHHEKRKNLFHAFTPVIKAMRR